MRGYDVRNDADGFEGVNVLEGMSQLDDVSRTDHQACAHWICCLNDSCEFDDVCHCIPSDDCRQWQSDWHRMWVPG